jgi:hypothetical protein
MTVEPPGRVVHTDEGITVITARLLPPNMNSAAILIGDPDLRDPVLAVVQMVAHIRRSLVPMAVAAGFKVDYFRTWFSIGQEIGSRSELEQFRSSHAAAIPGRTDRPRYADTGLD